MRWTRCWSLGWTAVCPLFLMRVVLAHTSACSDMAAGARAAGGFGHGEARRGAVVVARWVEAGLTASFGPVSVSVTPVSLLMFTVFSALVVDALLFVVHWAHHRVPAST